MKVICLPPWRLSPSTSALLAWHKGDALALGNGDSVATWADSSGSGHDALQATSSKQPTFENGAVRFDGVDDYLATNPNLVGDTLTLHLVVTLLAANSSNGRIVACSNESDLDYSTAQGFVFYHPPNTPALALYRNNGTVGTNVSIPVGAPQLATLRFDGTTYTFYLNGEQKLSASQPGGFNIQKLYTGAAVPYGAESANITVCEMLLHHDAQSEGELAQTWSYLREKYAL